MVWKICFIIILSIATLSVFLWIGLELASKEDKIAHLEKKLDDLESSYTSEDNIRADSLKGLEELENKTDNKGVGFKLENLGKMFNISEEQKTKLKNRLIDSALNYIKGRNNSGSMSKLSETELINRISELEEKSQIQEAKWFKVLKEIEDKNENAHQELQRQLLEMSTKSNPKVSQSNENTNNQQIIDLLLKLQKITEENKSKIKSLEKDMSNSEVENKLTKMKEKIENLEEKVKTESEAFNALYIRIYENLKAGQI